MKRISMRIFFAITLLFVCFIANAQTKTVKQEPSKEDYARRAKLQKPKAFKIQKDSVRKQPAKEKQQPSKKIFGKRSKWEKPKAIRMSGTKQEKQAPAQNSLEVKQSPKVVEKEQPKVNQQGAKNKKAIEQQQKSAEAEGMLQKYRAAKKRESDQQNPVAGNQVKQDNQESAKNVQNPPHEGYKFESGSHAPKGKLKDMPEPEKNLARQRLKEADAKRRANNEQQRKENSQNTPEKIMGVVPFFDGEFTPEKQYDEGMPDIIDSYEDSKNKNDSKKIDEALTKMKAKVEANAKVQSQIDDKRRKVEDLKDKRNREKRGLENNKNMAEGLKKRFHDVKAVFPGKSEEELYQIINNSSSGNNAFSDSQKKYLDSYRDFANIKNIPNGTTYKDIENNNRQKEEEIATINKEIEKMNKDIEILKNNCKECK